MDSDMLKGKRAQARCFLGLLESTQERAERQRARVEDAEVAEKCRRGAFGS
jgi:hypothetical protein